MSESQKREAKRLVEILIEMGFLNKIEDGVVEQGQYEAIYPKETWVKEVMQAIAIYQAEELAKAWQKLLIKRMGERKAKEECKK